MPDEKAASNSNKMSYDDASIPISNSVRVRNAWVLTGYLRDSMGRCAGCSSNAHTELAHRSNRRAHDRSVIYWCAR